MRKPASVPDDATAGPHRTSDLKDFGIARGRLRGGAFRSPYRGIHVATEVERGVRQRVHEAALLLPDGGAVGGWAVAAWEGVPGFDGSDGQGGELPVLLCVPPGARTTQRPGVRVLRSRLDPGEVSLVDGVPVTSRARSAADAVRTAGDLRRAVAVVDALWAGGYAVPDEIGAELARRPRQWGGPMARRALSLAAPGVKSPKESEFRMVWVLDAGLPVPLVNPRITDLHGRHLGRPDLYDDESGSCGEFDGGDHFDRGVATIDHVRQEGMERTGLVFGRFTSVDLWSRHRRRTVWRLRDLRARGLARRGEPRRWIVVPG